MNVCVCVGSRGLCVCMPSESVLEWLQLFAQTKVKVKAKKKKDAKF